MYIACPRFSKLGDVRKELEIYVVDGTGFLEDAVGSVERIVEICEGEWREQEFLESFMLTM